jgi:hypothetical protein
VVPIEWEVWWVLKLVSMSWRTEKSAVAAGIRVLDHPAHSLVTVLTVLSEPSMCGTTPHHLMFLT